MVRGGTASNKFIEGKKEKTIPSSHFGLFSLQRNVASGNEIGIVYFVVHQLSQKLFTFLES